MTVRAALGMGAAAVAALAVHAGVDAPAAARGGLALLAAIGLLWLTQALPLSVTALLVPLLAAGLGLLPLREALAAFAQPVTFVCLGGFALAAALTQHGLDRALARYLLRLARGRPWPAAPAVPGDGVARPPAPSSPSDAAATRTAAFVLLGVAYSASIGGMATLVGSPPNAIAAAHAGLDFAAWLAYRLPAALLLWPLMGLALAPLLRRLGIAGNADALVALAASCAFMLPVATPPNAIVYGAGVVGAGAMACAGLVLNVLALAVLGALTALRAG